MRRRARRLVLATLVALVVVPFSQPGAAAGGGFSFYGSGDGHGIGMSQWGAYGLAQMGWSHAQILRHFYRRNGGGGLLLGARFDPRRADVGPHDRPPEGAGAGPSDSGRARPTAQLVGKIPVGRDVERRDAKQRAWAVRDTDGHLVGGHLWGGPAPGSDRHVRRYGLARLHPGGGCDLVPGVLLRPRHDRDEPHVLRRRERLRRATDRSPPVRGLPARARRGAGVVADGGDARPGGRGADLRGLRRASTTVAGPTATATSPTASGDQTYIGWNREGGSDGDRWVQAVTSTAGEVVTYGRRVDPGLLRGVRRRALRQRRGRVARREPRLQDPVADRRVRPGRVHRREPLDRLDQDLHRGRGHVAARALHRLDRNDPAVHLDPARRGRPHHQRGRRRRRRQGDGHGHRDEVRPRLVRRARVDQQRSHDPRPDPGDLRPARVPARACRHRRNGRSPAAHSSSSRTAVVYANRDFGTDRVATGTDRSGVPCGGRGRGRAGRADEHAVGAHDAVEHLRRLQARSCSSAAGSTTRRRPAPMRSGAPCSTRI